MPTPYWPLLTPSGTAKLRSVTAAALPIISSNWLQPFSKPSPCRIVSTVSCVVPEREGDEMATWPNYSGRVRSFHSFGAGSLLAAR